MGKFDKAGANKAFANTKKAEQLNAKVSVLENIEIVNLVPNPNNNRNVEYTADIEASIQKHGFVNPLVVTDFGMEDGKYMIIAGHRRTEAAKKIGMEVLPCLVRHFNSQIEVDGCTIRDNSNRDVWENSSAKWLRAESLKKQLVAEGFTGDVNEQVAVEMGVTKKTVYRYFAMMKVIAPVWDWIADGIVADSAVERMAQHSEEEQNEIYALMQEALEKGHTLTRVFMKTLIDGYRDGKRSLAEILDTPRDSGLPLNGFINTEPTESREPNEDGNRNDEVRREFDPIAAEYDQMDADRKAWEEEQESAEETEDEEKEEKHELSPEEKYMKNGVELAKQLKKIDTIMQDIWKCETEEDARNMIINMSSVAQAFVDEMYRLADEHSIKEEAEKAFTDMKNAVEQYI